MKVPFVDLAALVAPDRAAYLEAFDKLLDTGGFVGGAAVTDFEAAFARHAGAAHACAVKTGTDALLLALRALGVGPGDEVITAPNSFFATAEAISHTGATPVFADVDDATLLIDPVEVARRIAPRTKAIVPVHLFGQLADVPALRQFGVPILEDAAQAHGATRADGRAGSWGDVAAFSFYPTKNLGALGEGGCITTNDPAIVERVRRLRDHGQADRHDHVEIGYNARLDAVQCAGLAISLRRLDAGNARRREHAARYRAGLAAIAGAGTVRLIAEAPASQPVYHLMVIRVAAAHRDAIRAELATAGVATAVHYPTPIHRQRAYAHLGLAAGSYPVAERAAAEMISLPMYPDLGEAALDHVVASLIRALE
ncbi:MAG: DegT/DnrJ/EryC1/StrS family aminotransferase [Deltaproteobacteria bacterium]|nr:DegT/DnrJ/EryC1/StrS family aminotransferase [Deltaproteobacteria bacterium]MDQ3298699.1 DegT/DnrJ/EryC1/StrS family aminotransferase [Myxococcota bacterium]